MAGITDAPFRRICRAYGAGMTTSEMTTADTSLWQTPKSRYRLDLDLDAEPVAVQIAGSEPAQLAAAARACVDRGAQIIDINMGCPAKKVCRKAAESRLPWLDGELADRVGCPVIGFNFSGSGVASCNPWRHGAARVFGSAHSHFDNPCGRPGQ